MSHELDVSNPLENYTGPDPFSPDPPTADLVRAGDGQETFIPPDNNLALDEGMESALGIEAPEVPLARPERPADEREERATRAEQAAAEAQGKIDAITRMAMQQAEQQQQAYEAQQAEEDPASYLQGKVQSLEQRLHQREAKEAYERTVGFVEQSEKRFVQQNPDYYDALDHAREHNRRTIVAGHPELSEKQVAKLVDNSMQALALRATQARQDPSAMAYQYARSVGFGGQPAGRPAQQAPAYQPAPAGRPDGSMPRPRPSAISLSAARGGGGRMGHKVNASDFDELSNAELNAILDDPQKIVQLQYEGHTTI